MTTYVYGYSDDLIEIEGSLSEEFNYPLAWSVGPYYLGFSDGTLLKITYDGDWNIKLVEGRSAIIKSTGQPYADLPIELPEYLTQTVPDYSDLAIIYSDVTWVVGGTDVVK